MRFDPKTVRRYKPIEYDEMPSNMVKGDDYDSLLDLYNAEREARKEDAKQFQRDLRDAYAEGDYNARNDAGTY